MSSNAQMTVYLDFKSPASYLALRPTLALAKKYSLAVRWLPFRVRMEAIIKQGKQENKGASHRRVRALARRNTHLLYADLQGIPMTFPEQPTPGTDIALAAMLFVRQAPVDFLQAAFAAYWVQHLDLDDPEVVLALLRQINQETTGFDLQTWRAALDESCVQADQAGVTAAPTFVIQDQLFIGREHLPWIESLAKSI